ncbi:MAG: glycine cleavage system aminomethyltransferase GcvT [Bacteroidaceae bacterium]|nr:glycine cleavage system aminomethyltransferase GcvT [Bacteroidaceae bacterium]
MEELKKTCLYEKHIALNAKMSPFGGFDMPIQYSSITNEHNAVRNNVGMFDVSHMGQVIVTGEQAEEFVNYLFTNDVSTIANGKTIYGMMLQPNGGVVDDLLVYKQDQNKYLLVINASNIDKDLNWIMLQNKNFKVGIENMSDYFGELAIQGPKSEETIQKLMEIQLSDLEFYSFKEVSYRGENIIISRTGYTGEDGFEIYGSHAFIQYTWDLFIKAGVTPCGLGCRDTLRFEAGLPLYGHELSEEINPIMAGLGIFVKLDKKDFVGKEAIQHYKENPTKKIIGLELVEKSVPRAGYPIIDENNKQVGTVTTGYLSPSTGIPVCMALVDIEHSTLGSRLFVKIRNKDFEAIVINKQFYRKNYKK